MSSSIHWDTHVQPFDMVIAARENFGSIFREIMMTACWIIWRMKTVSFFIMGFAASTHGKFSLLRTDLVTRDHEEIEEKINSFSLNSLQSSRDLLVTKSTMRSLACVHQSQTQQSKSPQTVERELHT